MGGRSLVRCVCFALVSLLVTGRPHGRVKPGCLSGSFEPKGWVGFLQAAAWLPARVVPPNVQVARPHTHPVAAKDVQGDRDGDNAESHEYKSRVSPHL